MNYAADVNNMHSQAEETIRSHIGNNNHSRADRPLVKGQHGKFYPKIPGSDYVSRFVDGFRGCFCCDSDAHQFRTCPDRNNPEVRRNFFLDMNAHVTSTRLKRNTAPTEQTAVQSNSMLVNSFDHTNSSSFNYNPVVKKARFDHILVRVFNISQAIKKPMPISINNSLPSVTLHLGLLEDEENTMRMLVDTGAAMNSGNLAYHLWVMSECPEMVGEFIQCGGISDYNVVKLLAALDLDMSQQPVEHGHMTAVIRYRTPYLVNKRDPLFISFALGNDVSLRCVLGLPTLLVIGGSINLVKGEIVCSEIICSEINRTFPLS